MPLTVGSLFSGIGGLDLGLERAGMRVVWQVEIDRYCQSVLAKHWPATLRFADVRECGAHNLAPVDLICGGFPCQDISSNGPKTGIMGVQSGLWSEFARILRELRPRFAIVENVPAMLARGMGTVLGDLAACGFDAEWQCLPACAFGSPQRRDRVFIIAHARDGRFTRIAKRDEHGAFPKQWDYADGLALAQRRAGDARSWVRRANRGIPNRVDRVKGLGNAVVPQVAEWVGRRIVESVQER